jgi:hypothetical protein
VKLALCLKLWQTPLVYRLLMTFLISQQNQTLRFGLMTTCLLAARFPLGEKSIGAAVFDGTNEFGFPYNINKNGSDSIADYLTSHYIRFNNPPNNLMLSFLYQRGGNGETPEIEDSLVVEFWSPIDSTWTRFGEQKVPVVPRHFKRLPFR